MTLDLAAIFGAGLLTFVTPSAAPGFGGGYTGG